MIYIKCVMLRPFQQCLAISKPWVDDNKRQCAMETHLRLRRSRCK